MRCAMCGVEINSIARHHNFWRGPQNGARYISRLRVRVAPVKLFYPPTCFSLATRYEPPAIKRARRAANRKLQRNIFPRYLAAHIVTQRAHRGGHSITFIIHGEPRFRIFPFFPLLPSNECEPNEWEKGNEEDEGARSARNFHSNFPFDSNDLALAIDLRPSNYAIAATMLQSSSASSARRNRILYSSPLKVAKT